MLFLRSLVSCVRGAPFLRRIVHQDPTPLPLRAIPEVAALVGVELEYRVLIEEGIVDFRDIMHGLQLGCRFLDPADANAYHLMSGAAVTADEAEAEIALPPFVCLAGFSHRVEQQISSERARLQSRLGGGLRLEGWSTHVSVGSAIPMDERTALIYARTYAPAMMLLMDRVSSPGLLVRPRPHRIELGGEFASGARLAAVVAFAVGSVLSCQRAMENRGAKLPPTLSLRLQLDDRRYGWFVDRRAFGQDLYKEGRKARLSLARGGTITAQEHLETCWQIAREALTGIADENDFKTCDAMVSGTVPLPIEDGEFQEECSPIVEQEQASIYGQVLGARNRIRFELAPVMVTWHVCVFLIVNPDRTRRCFACVPRQYLESFVEQIDSGKLDETIDAYLHRRPSGRILNRCSQALVPALYDEIGARINLLPIEWDANYKRLRRRLVVSRIRPPAGATERDPAYLPVIFNHTSESKMEG